MKNIKKIIVLSSLFLLAGCSSTVRNDRGDDGFIDGAGYYGEPSSSTSSGSEDKNDNDDYPESGQITCAAIDDNLNYDYWQNLIGNGDYKNYHQNFAFKTSNRIDLTINNGNEIYVKLKDDSFTAHVDNLHKTYLFPNELKDEYDVTISYLDENNVKQELNTTVKDGDEIDLENQFNLSNNLQIMFVIDATGSMGDEMRYIQSEIKDVITSVYEENDSINIELAMMVYRDKGDDYITKYSDFTTDIDTQVDFLMEQEANGGGDFEEAVQIALDEAIKKQWSTGATKLLFHVADAPAHDKDVESWNKTVLKASELGIKIISVASSGIDEKTEYFFRSQSILTAAKYIFLTNDSGIGEDHLIAKTDEEYVIEYLNDCLIRIIKGYFSGEFEEPVSVYQNNQ